MNVIPYINLSGNAEQALNRYQEVFGGKVEIMRWSQMPPNPKMPVDDDWQDKVMHGSLTMAEGVAIYAADSLQSGEPSFASNVFLHMEFDTEDQLRSAFDALSAGGTVNMPVDKTFWGAVYGDLVDTFGVGWGMHYQLPQ